MHDKILKTIFSCKTYSQVSSCADWLIRIGVLDRYGNNLYYMQEAIRIDQEYKEALRRINEKKICR